VPLFFIKRSEVGVALLFFDKERERSGTLKKRERLTHCSKRLNYLVCFTMLRLLAATAVISGEK
jgi:hypothetical protein